jgi:hypothetical protein
MNLTFSLYPPLLKSIWQKLVSATYCTAICILFLCQTAIANTSMEMEFKVVDVCDISQNCYSSILANGTVTAKSANAFLKIAEGSISPMTVFINGKGNDLQAGIALGKAIRSKGFDTQTGLNAESSEKIGQKIKYVQKEGGECLSACLLAFLGGHSRISHPNDILGFYRLPSTTDDGNETKLRSMAAEYMTDMGVNSSALDYLSISKSDQIQRLLASQLQRIPFAVAKKLNIDNYDLAPRSPWHIKTTASGQIIAVISEKDKRSQFSATIALTKPTTNDAVAAGNLRLIIFVKPLRGALSPSEIAKIISTNSEVSIRTNNFAVNNLNAKKWEQYQEGIQSFILLPIQSLEQIADARSFELVLPLPESFTTSPTLRFSTEGLKSAIAAFKK